MTFTYDVSTISTNQTAQVRLLVGDTDANEQLMQDEEIAYIVSIERGTYYAAARTAEAIAALFARRVTTMVGDLRVLAEKKYEHYLELAAQMRTTAALGDAAPVMWAGSQTTKDASEADTDRVQPYFTREFGMFPGSSAAANPSLTL